jgi:hypothetical protein
MNKVLLLIILIYTQLHLFSQSIEISAAEYLVNSTVKIEAIEEKIVNGKTKRFLTSGTGFFFEFDYGAFTVPVIVTNRHVVSNSKDGWFYLKIVDSNRLVPKKIDTVKLDQFSKRWIYHPDTAVDLAIYPIARYLNKINSDPKSPIKILYTPYREKDLPADSIYDLMLPIEDIYMIGYPFGLRDKANDLPIVRKGITATPFYIDYNGAKEFLCDVPVYPGSSGSPIVLYNAWQYTDRKGRAYVNGRVTLLGINYATYTRDFKGKVLPNPSFNIEDSISVETAIPYNIAIVIKSSKLLDFKPMFEKK